MMDVTVYFHDDDHDDPDPEDEEKLTCLMRDFADWIYARLEAEDTWLNSDEYIDEQLNDDEHEFEESGTLI